MSVSIFGTKKIDDQIKDINNQLLLNPDYVPVNKDSLIDKEYVDSAFSQVSGALVYRGTYDALNNIPALVSGVGTTGDYYVVNV